MSYTKDEIDKYTNILKNSEIQYQKEKERQDKIKNQRLNKSNSKCRLVFLDCSKKEIDEKVKWIVKKIQNKKSYGECEHEYVEHSPGFAVCRKSGKLIQRLDHSANYSDYQRTLYDRRYHFDNKVQQVIDKFNLDLN